MDRITENPTADTGTCHTLTRKCILWQLQPNASGLEPDYFAEFVLENL